MPTLSDRKNLVLIGVEAAYKTEQPTLAVLPIKGPANVNPQAGGKLARGLSRLAFGPDEQIEGFSYGSVGFQVELAGATALGTAPVWGPLLRAMGFAQVLTPSTRAVYSVVETGHESLTLAAAHDSNRYSFIGCRGSASLAFASNQLPTMDAQMMGYNLEHATVAISEAWPTFAKPKTVSTDNTTLSLFGESACLSSLSLNIAPVMTSPTDFAGCDEIGIVNVEITGTVTIKDLGISAKDWIALSRADTAGAFTLTHGPAGNQIIIAATGVTLGEVDPNQSVNGARSIALPLVFNNHLTITVQ
jgi:hypothetical protein